MATFTLGSPTDTWGRTWSEVHRVFRRAVSVS
jgi:hypothetical protein